MYKIAAMGDKDSVSGFLAIGLEVSFVSDKADAQKALKKYTEQEDYAPVFVTEEIAALISDEIEKLKDKVNPAIILIPGVKGNTGEGLKSISRSVERAVGSVLSD